MVKSETRTPRVRRRSRALAPTAAGAALLLLCLGSSSLAPAREARQERDPDAEWTLEPVTRTAPSDASAPAAESRGEAEPAGIEEGPLPEEEYERAKREAAHADAPAADDLPDPETLAPEARGKATIVESFAGLDQNAAGGFYPPDTSLAVGPETLVQVVNVRGRILARDGTVLSDMTMQDHFDVVDSAPMSDPKVVWDPHSNRFVMVILELDFPGRVVTLHLAVSRDAVPRSLGDAGWCRYEIDTVRDDTWGDYPQLGFNEQWLAVATNNFGFSGGYFESRLFVLDKSKLKGTLTSCPSLKVSAFNLGGVDAKEFVFNPQPAQHLTTTAEKGKPLYLLASHYVGASSGTADGYELLRVSGRKKRPKLSTELATSGALYGIPPNALQPANLELDSGDIRVMQQLTYRDGHIWAAHATRCEVRGSKQTLSCVRVVRILPEGETGASVDFEQTLGRKNEFFWWPGVIETATGDVIVAALRGGTSRYIETALFGMAPGASRFEERARFGKPRTSEAGECAPINVSFTSDGRNIARSGDYLGLSPDPTSDDIWLAGEHGALAFGTSCIWGTSVTRLRF